MNQSISSRSHSSRAHYQRNGRFRQGVVAVEMALILPLLLLFFFAAFEFTRVAMMRPTVDSAVYDAARRAMVPGARRSDAETVARNLLLTIGLTDADISISPLARDTPEVTVTIEVSIEDNTVFPVRFFKDKTIRRTLTLRREGIDI